INKIEKQTEEKQEPQATAAAEGEWNAAGSESTASSDYEGKIYTEVEGEPDLGQILSKTFDVSAAYAPGAGLIDADDIKIRCVDTGDSGFSSSEDLVSYLNNLGDVGQKGDLSSPAFSDSELEKPLARELVDPSVIPYGGNPC